MKQLTLEISERQEQVTYSALIGPCDQHSSLIGPCDQYSPLIGPRDQYSPLIGAGGAERGSPAAAAGHPRLCHQIQTQQGEEETLPQDPGLYKLCIMTRELRMQTSSSARSTELLRLRYSQAKI